MLRHLALGLAGAGLLLAAGCSSSDDGAGESGGPDADASSVPSAAPGISTTDLTTGLVALYAGDHPEQRDSDNGACVADAVLERLSPADLAAAGVVVDDAVVATLPALDDATATTWAQAQLSCTDFVEESTRALVAQTKGKLAADTYAGCLRAALSDGDVEAAVADTLSGDFASPEVTALSDAQVRCSQGALPPD